jgi:hypothetical protein
MSKIIIPENLSMETVSVLYRNASEVRHFAYLLRKHKITDLADEADELCRKLKMRARALSAYLKD